MNPPLYAVPAAAGDAAPAEPGAPATDTAAIPRSVGDVLRNSQIETVFDELDRALIGLAPVKTSRLSGGHAYFAAFRIARPRPEPAAIKPCKAGA